MSYTKGLKEALKIVQSAESLEMAADLIEASIQEAPEENESALSTSKSKLKKMMPDSSGEAIANVGSKFAGAATKVVASAVKQEMASQLRKTIRGALRGFITKK